MSYKVAQITDCHLIAEQTGRVHGIAVDKTLRAVLELVAAWQPDLVIATGDLTDAGDAEAYTRLIGYLERLDALAIVLPGNHDHSKAVQRHIQDSSVISPSYFDTGHWRLCLLDTSEPGQEAGFLTRKALVNLDKQLADARNAAVFMHHPPVAVGSSWIDAKSLQHPEAFFAVAMQHPSLRVITAGHVHQEHCVVLNGRPIYTTPATSSQAMPFRGQFEDDTLGPGFRWFEFHDNGEFTTGVHRTVQPATEY